MSPRTTQRLHQAHDVLRFSNIILVFHEGSGLGRKPYASALSCGGLRDRLACRLGPTHTAPAGALRERIGSLAAESQRKWVSSSSHLPSTVARIELHDVLRQ